ncbi:MAG: response regulator transcription factor [Gammaproteobacteria bacterium]|nr:response regulator transcription factor [Gammaproteobacteria bacterium]
MRILVIEDDLRLQKQIADQLQAAGYAVDVCADGVEGDYMAREYPVDLAIVDLGLPEMSGLEVIRALRAAQKDYPVLILTARSEWQEKVEGLEAGADDYLTKPFHMQELLARLQALLRRSAGHSSPVLRFADLQINLSSQLVELAGQPLSLTSFEYKMLEYFVLHPRTVVTKAQLNEHLYNEDADPDSNVLEVVLGRLRRKIDPDGSRKPIETLRGRGYRFNLLAENSA